MTRQIKFRAWDSGFKEWIVDTLLFYPQSGHVFNTKRRNFCSKTDENIILMQFTGLLDKNGKEIYEGDVVKITNFEHLPYKPYDRASLSYDRIGSVGFVDGYWKASFGDDLYWAKKNPLFDIEIIGNIYQNPELLK